MKISEIIPKDDYILFIKTEDGQTGMFNVKPYLESEAFRPLKDRVEFNKVHRGKRNEMYPLPRNHEKRNSTVTY